MNELKILNLMLADSPDGTSYGLILVYDKNEDTRFLYFGAKYESETNEDLIKHILTNGMKISMYDFVMLEQYIGQIETIKEKVKEINDKTMGKN